ncbi:MAG: hypothetical protein HYX75_24745 [Acidobacteria bacterium]|nr:hypothetical protein [Acidobacteriota bacterium]
MLRRVRQDMRYKVATIVGLVAAATLAYGYWHVSSHASLYISVQDISDRKHPRPLLDVELRFLDFAGNELAQAKAEVPYGVVSVTQPAAYSCQELEKRAAFSPQAREQWGRCFERQSRWLMTWVRKAKYVDLKSGPCRIQRIPISVSEYRDSWWAWWVPLPHVGGKPYTGLSIYLTIDRDRCATVVAPI